MAFEPEINGKTIIADVLREYPHCVEVFDKYNMPCLTCMGASTGTIEEGAMMHDVNLERILEDLRRCCNRHNGLGEQGTTGSAGA